MRRVRAVLVFAAVVCAFGALSAPAFAKEKKVFGEFIGTPGQLKLAEKEAEVEEMTLGPYKFGRNAQGAVCDKDLTVKGEVTEEHSPSLTTELGFVKCNTSAHEGGFRETKAVSFKLGVKFIANHSAEAGQREGVEILKPSVITFKGALKKCVVEIPAQFLPASAETRPEKEYIEAEYSNETPEPIERWEKSKRLKEQYPSGFKERIEIDAEFKKVVTYVKPEKTCEYEKGEEGKFITEEGNPHKGEVEFTNGKIFLEIDELEVNGGELRFEEPSE